VQILLDGEVGATLLAFGKVLLDPRSVDLVKRAVDEPRQADPGTQGARPREPDPVR
jgi:hypothetical protein